MMDGTRRVCRVKRTIALLTVVAALMVVPLAAAGSSTMLDGYARPSKPVVQVKGSTGSTSSQPKPSTTADTLPFTGFDLAVFMAAGAVLVGAGFALRRVGRDSK